MRSKHIVGPLCISADDAAGAAPRWIQFVATEESGRVSYVVEEAVSPTERKSGERSYRALKFQSKDLGTTILHWAAARGHVEVVRLLLAAADIYVEAKVHNGGYTALHYAAARGHGKVVNELLENGAYVNAKDDRGRTALHWAANEGHDKVVDALCAQGSTVELNMLFNRGYSRDTKRILRSRFIESTRKAAEYLFDGLFTVAEGIALVGASGLIAAVAIGIASAVGFGGGIVGALGAVGVKIATVLTGAPVSLGEACLVIGGIAANVVIVSCHALSWMRNKIQEMRSPTEQLAAPVSKPTDTIEMLGQLGGANSVEQAQREQRDATSEAAAAAPKADIDGDVLELKEAAPVSPRAGRSLTA